MDSKAPRKLKEGFLVKKVSYIHGGKDLGYV